MKPDGVLQFALGTGSNFSIVTTNTSVLDQPQDWTHIAGVYTGGQIQIYRNGVREGQLTMDLIPLGNGGDLYIGRAWAGGSPQRHFTGMLTEVKFFSGALSENAIRSLYRS